MGFMIHSLPGGFDKLIPSQETLLSTAVIFIADIPNISALSRRFTTSARQLGWFLSPTLSLTPV